MENAQCKRMNYCYCYYYFTVVIAGSDKFFFFSISSQRFLTAISLTNSFKSQGCKTYSSLTMNFKIIKLRFAGSFSIKRDISHMIHSLPLRVHGANWPSTLSNHKKLRLSNI